MALGILVSGCSVKLPDEKEARILLSSVAEVVLPSSLDDKARNSLVREFWNSLDGYKKGTRRVRPREFPSEVGMRGSSPAGPKGRYLEQLGKLSGETDGKFPSLPLEQRRKVLLEILEDTVPKDMKRLPWPAALVGQPGDHVALGLASFFLYSRSGRRLAEGGEVSPFTCQSMEGVEERPSGV